MTTVAVLYQAAPAPAVGGARKDPKPGGYADSGADIACALRRRGVRVVTPVADPDPARDLDWVFPDTTEGIARAGATHLWANTVLFAEHPLARVDAWIIGQSVDAVQRADDKFRTNALLAAHGLPVARSILVRGAAPAEVGAFPLIVKPVRGRGSQGVTLVEDRAALERTIAELIATGRFGDELIVEEFLAGSELTVTVIGERVLPPVRRFAHVGAIAPYNGDVPVSHNSVALTADEHTPAVRALVEHCQRAAQVVGARAPIRIDCRADASGTYKLFDLNMKPNMTGPGRPGRDEQDSLSALAARAIGWTYDDLIAHMLAGAWRQSTDHALA